MSGSLFKRCPCAPRYDSKGRRSACNKKHGSWYFVLNVKDPLSASRRQVKKGGFATKAEAEKALAQARYRVETGRYRHDGGITVSNYLDGWIADKSAHLRPTTLRDYGRHIDFHIVPSLGHLRLGDLRTSHVTRLLQDLLSGARGTTLGPTSVRRVHATLRSALTDAVRDELIDYNAAQNAIVPSRPRPRVNPWEPEELGAFLDHVAADPLGPVFELIANTGLRRGEAAGLRWSDVNLEEGFLVIRNRSSSSPVL